MNYVPDEVLIGNGQGTFTELKQFGKSSGGLGPDNRIGIYLGDSWKVKQNLTVSTACAMSGIPTAPIATLAHFPR